MPLEAFPNRYPFTAPSPDVQGEDPNKTNQAFKDLNDKVSKLVNNWKDEVEQTQVRRDMRYMKVDVEEKRRTGEFKSDEIYIPIHVIHDNIVKEQAQYIAYTTASRNTCVFKCKEDAELDTQPLEEWFTKLSRYPKWECPIIQLVDGAQTHGWDFVEVVLDTDKPGHFAIEHIAHENLLFPFDIEWKAFQDSPVVVRNCKVTKARLEKFNEVNLEQVEKLFKGTENQTEVQATVEIQKVFYKQDGVVYVCWMCYNKCDDYIRAPKPLYLGRKKQVFDDFTGVMVSSEDIYESNYPLVCLPYIISENGKLRDTKGRVSFDEYVQEAVSSLVSSIVNGYHRASLIMGAPKNSSSSGAMEQTDCPIEGGRFYNQSVDFFNMPYPDASGMSIVNALITQNKAETAQVNYAAGNRQDYSSRKTAEEIKSAKSDASLLGGVQVTLYSICLREIYTICWSIAQSRAQQGLLDEVDVAPSFLYKEYQLFPAGDTEVIKREEQKQALMSAWPVISSTPAAMPMLEDLLTLLFPTRAHIYIAALRQGDPKNLITALAGILSAVDQQHPQVFGPREPQVKQILQQAQQTTQQTPQGQQQNGQPTKPTAAGTPQSPTQQLA